MLDSSDFAILLLSVFFAMILALGLMMFLFFAVSGKKLNKFLSNELNSKVSTLIDQLGSSTGKQIWKQERAAKGGTAKGKNSAGNSSLTTLLGPELATAAQFLPPELRDPLVKLAADNPQLLQVLLTSLQGAQPVPGTPVAGQAQIPANEFPPE